MAKSGKPSIRVNERLSADLLGLLDNLDYLEPALDEADKCRPAANVIAFARHVALDAALIVEDACMFRGDPDWPERLAELLAANASRGDSTPRLA